VAGSAGTSGYSGYSGFTGTVGTSGYSGFSGSAGAGSPQAYSTNFAASAGPFNNTYFICVNGGIDPAFSFSTTEALVTMVVPKASTAITVYVRTNATQSGGNGVIKLRVNGSDSAFNLTIPDTTVAGVYGNTGSLSLSAGDLVSWHTDGAIHVES